MTAERSHIPRVASLMTREFCRFSMLAAVSCTVVMTSACEREKRDYRGAPGSASPAPFVRTTDLQPGEPTRAMGIAPYQENRWAVSEGQRMFNAFNCVGCHANGGGGIGPPLADREWIYGSRPEQIYATITEGRPNGMPSFGGKLGSAETWRLVAYVRSMAKLTPRDLWPARADDMSDASPVGNGK